MGVQVREKRKGSGEWWLFINHNGQRRSKKIGTNKREADNLATVLAGRLAAGSLGMDDLNKKEEVKPFKYFMKQWFDMGCPTKKEGGLKASSIEDYRTIHRSHLMTAPFYNKPVDKITENDIEVFLGMKRQERARSTVQHIKNLISHGFQRAMKSRTIRINPSLGAAITEPEDKPAPFKADPYNAEEIQTLLNAFKGHEYYSMVLFMVRTGCRSSEVAAVTWDDIDLNNRKANISKGYVRGRVTGTKSGKGRKIDLTPVLVAELKKLKLRNQANGSTVFQGKTGGYVNMGSFVRNAFRSTCKKAGLKRTRLHDLRHSYISLLIEQTQDIYYAQQQAGHHSIVVTCDRYGHLLNDKSETRKVDILDKVATG